MPHRTDPTLAAPTPTGHPGPAPGWTARLPTFAAAHVMILAAATMVAISAVFGMLPQG